MFIYRRGELQFNACHRLIYISDEQISIRPTQSNCFYFSHAVFYACKSKLPGCIAAVIHMLICTPCKIIELQFSITKY